MRIFVIKQEDPCYCETSCACQRPYITHVFLSEKKRDDYFKTANLFRAEKDEYDTEDELE